ncbi:DUF4333 domain-containing protein [Mycobacterium sp. ML4]
MSTPRDYNQPPWPRRAASGPVPGPPPPGGTPWYQQPVARPSPYPGRYGQPGPYGPPGQWSQPPPAPPVKAPKTSGSRSKPFLIGGAIIAVLIAGTVVALLVAGGLSRDTKKVAVAAVQNEVQQTLVDRITGYNSDDITDVRCNNGQDPTVKKGGSFTCDVTVRGQQRQLKVTFLDDNGTYAVGLPQLDGGK